MGKVYGQCKDIQVSITRPNNTDAYIIGDVCGTSPATNIEFANISTQKGGDYAGNGVIITGASLEVDVNAIPSGMSGFRLHLYKSAPTAIADNAAYNLPSGDRLKYIGNIPIDTPEDLGDTLFSRNNNINMQIALADGGNSIYGILETRGAFTPSAQTVKKVTLYVLEV